MRGDEGSARILPGRLVLVVGPSGAGKDSLIRHARERLAGDDAFVFPRRVVTRPSSAAEDNIEADEATFARWAGEGAFATSWEAHGLHYGIPADIDAQLGAGRSVVCNVSRTVVGDLRRRYANAVVVEVTAPAEVLADRLAARGRTADGKVLDRLSRSAEIVREKPDVIINNDGPLETSGEELLSALFGQQS